MRNIIISILMIVLSTNNSFSQVESKSFDVLLKTMLKNTVTKISVKELMPKIDQVVLLDAREPQEYEVSHLKNAKFVGFNQFNISILQYLPKNSEIVVYCSIGVRSEKIGEKLKAAGFTNVKNLYGSIFEWVNQGNQVFDTQNRPTKKVHAFNKKWGVWLNKGEKVY